MRPILAFLYKTTALTPVNTVTPPSQSTSGASGSHTFSAETSSITNGTASAYNWVVVSSSGGTFALATPTAASCTPSVSGVAAQATANATIRCDATVGGQVYSDTATLSWQNTTAGGTAATYTPVAGTYSATDGGLGNSVTYSIAASKSVTWTWSVSYGVGTAGASADVTSGSAATGINLTLNPALSASRQATFTVTAADGVANKTWTVTLTTAAANQGGVGVTVSAN